MKRISLIIVSGLMAGPLHAQAPAAADLWRLTASSLTRPPALESGWTAPFWNPAAACPTGRFGAGVQILETPDVINLSGLLAGVNYRLPAGTCAVALVANVKVGDLVRTTTSPASEPGEIPVYEEVAGLGLAWRAGPVGLGMLLRGHTSRFDAARDRGLTADVGARFAPWNRLTLGAATHFFPANLSDRTLTDYYLGAEYLLHSMHVSGIPARVRVRYGLTARAPSAAPGSTTSGGGGVEHAIALAAELSHLSIETQAMREVAYGDVQWRSVVGLGLRVGRYSVAAARSSGLGGIGASYRVALDVDVVQ